MNDSIWKELKAVQNKKVYCIPNVPYSFLNNPPSINRVIGINWLGNLLYPDQYQLEIKDEIKTFYQLFYTVDLTDEQYDIIVNNKG
jgi:iron complex transport system substrate-binding protein